MAADEISRLRNHAEKHPDDARSKALLANHLRERGQSSGAGGDGDFREAICLARASIDAAPDDAVGHAVLSTIPAVAFRDRMVHLRKAIDLDQRSSKEDTNNAACRVSAAANLVRLLVEPRDEMARGKAKLVAKSIMRQDLSVNDITGEDERVIYDELRTALETGKCIIWKKRKERWQQQQSANSQLDAFCSIPPIIERLARIHYRLGTFFRTLKPQPTHRPKSMHHFRSVLELLDPPHMVDSYSLAERSHDLHDVCVKAQFWLGTFEQDGHSTDDISMQVDRCPPQYVTSLYSKFAETFDTQLVEKLKYQTPTKLRQLVDEVLDTSGSHAPGGRFGRGADLGCGTGLSGAAFQNLVDRLDGVDLSKEMIDKADERGCYTSLHVGDVESILQDGTYDIIISCDVFVYIGCLSSVFESVARRLAPMTGVFAFSTELLGEKQTTGRDAGFALQSCARFAHKQSYLRNLAIEHGFTVRALKKGVIRRNGGEDVHGLLAVLSLE